MIERLFSSIRDLAKKEVKHHLSSLDAQSTFTRFGTVTDATGRPKVRFDVEDAATDRRYPYVASYTPVTGDRVMLVRGGNTWVVVGKVI
ncbi:hypothetical protein L1N85_11455 [Paenibacillus alkaliterrae]|uniref:hypothetical protein n=1 Tax=Paenibacillus alkaliterrae TaxID=320909 RepID=UPI001F3159BF|nr:hypothetical protein [Paenibacillus alkaliterrae]MCF2939053.1 hypothetical protein [Paenibacillus alkaliterrae]